jgi:hypothetical protein
MLRWMREEKLDLAQKLRKFMREISGSCINTQELTIIWVSWEKATKKSYSQLLAVLLVLLLVVTRNESRGGSFLYEKCYRSSLLKKVCPTIFWSPWVFIEIHSGWFELVFKLKCHDPILFQYRQMCNELMMRSRHWNYWLIDSPLLSSNTIK